MSDDFEFVNDGRANRIWSDLLNKINPKKSLDKRILKITMTSALEKRIRGAMYMGNIDSVAQFCKLAFTLLEKLIDAKASGGRMFIQDKDGKIREIGL